MDGFVFLFGLVVAAVSAYWVYKDAKSRELEIPLDGGVLTFLLTVGVHPHRLVYCGRSMMQKKKCAINVQSGHIAQ